MSQRSVRGVDLVGTKSQVFPKSSFEGSPYCCENNQKMCLLIICRLSWIAMNFLWIQAGQKKLNKFGVYSMYVLGKCQRMYFLHCHPRIFITYMCIFFCISFCISYIKERQYLLNWIHWYLCSFILFMWYQICPLGGATYIRCLLMTLSLELFEYCSVCSDWITVVFWGIADVHQCFP